MKKLLFSLVMMAFAVSAMNAQAVAAAPQAQKECCKDHKDGQKCDKPADQQCPDCKAKAAKQECKKAEGQKCEKAAGMKHECKEGMKKCEKAEGMKHECKDGMKKCEKAEGMKHECKGGMKKCEKAEAAKHECKDHKDGKCDKPADQQCPDCKAKAAAKKN